MPSLTPSAIAGWLSVRASCRGETRSPWGQAIFATSVRFLCAYRMQLFLYIKQCGATELGTSNAWLGMDAPETPAG